MAYIITADENIWKKFWYDEQTSLPISFKDASNVWHTTEEDFLGFCKQCWRVYELDNVALLFVEKMNKSANIHFSILRGNEAKPLIPDFIKIRDELFGDIEMIFGWAWARNKGLQRILESVGFKFHGFEMYHGHSRGRVLEWKCFSVDKTSCDASRKLLV